MITVSPTPEDPSWPANPPPGAELLYFNWPVRDDGEAGPPDAVTAALATAVVAGGAAVFLGADGHSPTADWVPTSPGSWIIRVGADWAARRAGMPRHVTLTCTIDADVARVLFDQANFQWSQRGQCVFLFEPEGLPRSVDAASIVVALQRDPPGPLPNHCQGYLRPGTDGDFAELAIRDPDRKCRLLHSLA